MDYKTIESWMLVIPAGCIALRDDRKKEQWDVNIQEFSLSKFLVTQELYFSIMRSNPSAFSGSNKPVESISWYEAIAFCNALSDMAGFEKAYSINPNSETVSLIKGANGYRLPTDAEWEYACRAGSKAVQYG